MKLTTVQLYEDTKRKLESKKLHQRESYDSALKRILEGEEIPSMEEMFRIGDGIKQKRRYTTKEIIKMSHEFWLKR